MKLRRSTQRSVFDKSDAEVMLDYYDRVAAERQLTRMTEAKTVLALLDGGCIMGNRVEVTFPDGMGGLTLNQIRMALLSIA